MLKVPLRVVDQRIDYPDVYRRPFTLAVTHPEVGTVTLADIRYGCEEAQDLVPDLEVFAHDLVKGYKLLCYLRENVRPEITSIEEGPG